MSTLKFRVGDRVKCKFFLSYNSKRARMLVEGKEYTVTRINSMGLLCLDGDDLGFSFARFVKVRGPIVFQKELVKRRF